jgi:hypothetical protein
VQQGANIDVVCIGIDNHKPAASQDGTTRIANGVRHTTGKLYRERLEGPIVEKSLEVFLVHANYLTRDSSLTEVPFISHPRNLLCTCRASGNNATTPAATDEASTVMAFSLGSIGAPPKEIANLPWQERDRIEAATNQRMLGQYGLLLGMLAGLRSAIFIFFPAVMIGSSLSIDPQGPAYLLQARLNWIALGFLLIGVALMITYILLHRRAWRRAFQTQLVVEGLLPPSSDSSASVPGAQNKPQFN